MSHQINFYLTPNDLLELEGRIRSKGDLLILHDRSRGETPRVVEPVNFCEDGVNWLHLFLMRPEDIKSIVMRYVPAQNYWVVDVVESPVIELSRCFFDEKIMRPGRVYYQDSYFSSDGRLIEKTDGFQEWAKTIFKEIRRKLTKSHDFYYIGPDAQKWKANGGVLKQTEYILK